MIDADKVNIDKTIKRFTACQGDNDDDGGTTTAADDTGDAK